jgi:hypothetical protein
VEPLLLDKALPALAAELSALLEKAGENDLAMQVPQLRVVDRCRCGDEFCATVYTASRPIGCWGAGYENIELEPAQGFFILDLVDGRIVCVEVLYRNGIRDEVQRVFP